MSLRVRWRTSAFTPGTFMPADLRFEFVRRCFLPSNSNMGAGYLSFWCVIGVPPTCGLLLVRNWKILITLRFNAGTNSTGPFTWVWITGYSDANSLASRPARRCRSEHSFLCCYRCGRCLVPGEASGEGWVDGALANAGRRRWYGSGRGLTGRGCRIVSTGIVDKEGLWHDRLKNYELSEAKIRLSLTFILLYLFVSSGFRNGTGGWV
jgi:hypothetical protein